MNERAWMKVDSYGCCHAVDATISTLKLNFSPVRGLILMQLLFRWLELPEFILLAIELSLKSARFLAMPRRGRYYIHVYINI